MPRYKVLEPGFYGSVLYKPDHPRRNVLVTDKPFPKGKLPSWLKPMKDETATAAKARVKKDTAADKAAQTKAADDQKDIQNASFLGEGENANPVETL